VGKLVQQRPQNARLYHFSGKPGTGPEQNAKIAEQDRNDAQFSGGNR